MPIDPAKRKASNQRYNQSDKGKANKQRSNQSDKGKATKQAYDQTDKGKARKQAAKQRAASAAAERAASAASASLAFVTELKKLTHAQRVSDYFSEEELAAAADQVPYCPCYFSAGSEFRSCSPADPPSRQPAGAGGRGSLPIDQPAVHGQASGAGWVGAGLRGRLLDVRAGLRHPRGQGEGHRPGGPRGRPSP
jgi:hypothetical protein